MIVDLMLLPLLGAHSNAMGCALQSVEAQYTKIVWSEFWHG